MPRTHKQRDREGFAASCACSLLCFRTPQTFNPLQTTCLRHASQWHISHIWKHPPEHLSHQPLFPSTKISLRPSQHLHHAPSSFQNFEELTMDTRCSWDTVLHGAPYNMYTAFFVENPKHGCTCQPCYHDVCRDLHHGKQFEDNTRLYTRGLATLWRISRSSRSITTWSLHALQSVMTKRERENPSGIRSQGQCWVVHAEGVDRSVSCAHHWRSNVRQTPEKPTNTSQFTVIHLVWLVRWPSKPTELATSRQMMYCLSPSAVDY